MPTMYVNNRQKILIICYACGSYVSWPILGLLRTGLSFSGVYVKGCGECSTHRHAEITLEFIKLIFIIMFSQTVCSNTNFFIYQCALFLFLCKYSNYKKILTVQPGHRFLSIDILRIETNLILGSPLSALISLKFSSVMGTFSLTKFL